MMNLKYSALTALLLGITGMAQAQDYTSHLDKVLQAGQLAVCTTGDYKPYTLLREDGEYEGIDITMARSLAKSLGVNVQWVPTTWKNLMPDMVAGKCDIGMGGISVSLERQKKRFSATRWTSMAKSRWCAAPIRPCIRLSSRSTSPLCV